MVAFIFHQSSTTSLPKWSVLFLPVQQCGCSAGNHSFSFSIFLAYWLLSSGHSRLLRYADDFVPGNSYRKCSDQDGLDDELSRRSTWSAYHGLIINKNKCAECIFNSKKTIALNSRSPSYLVSKLFSILVYISPLTWPGPLISMLSSQYVFYFLFLFAGSVLWTSTSPFMVNRFSLCYPLKLCVYQKC